MNSAEPVSPDWSAALPVAVHEVEDFLSAAGWDQPPQLFALVPTAELLAVEPGLADRLPSPEGLTPVAQEPLSGADLVETLDGICWPEEVSGCALAQEILVLPPGAEAELDRAVAEVESSTTATDLEQVAVRVARHHPERRDARLVVAVLRAGEHCCLLRLRGAGDEPDELVERPDLAPNMVTALLRTLRPG